MEKTKTRDQPLLTNGQALEPSWLTSILFDTNSKSNVEDIAVLNHISGVHSSTMKLQYLYKNEDMNGNGKKNTLYWKRVVVRDLPLKASYKLIRDVNSYITEALFYERLAQELNSLNIRVPSCMYVHKVVVPSNLVQSEFLIILEDLGQSGYEQQHIHLSKQQVLNCLNYLASLHGTYWNRFDNSQVPQSGTYWTYDKRPANEEGTIPEKWQSFCNRFSQVSDLFSLPNIRSLGDRLLKWLPWLNEQLHAIESWTLVHGDFKSANIFFNDQNHVAAIDWQWSGPGKAISDVMYLLLGTYNMGLGMKNNELEKELLTHYCGQLEQHYHIVYSVSDALRHFKIATLDFSRIILAYFFDGQTPQSIEACASDPGELTHTSSIPHVIDLIRYLDQLLNELESNKDF